MDYVCNVVGDLHIKDIDLSLSYMEIVDLSQEDFKISPRLRESLRKNEIVAYNPATHRNARRLKRRNQIKVITKTIEKKITSDVIPNFKELEQLTSVCGGISKKMDNLMSKLDNMIEMISASNESTQLLNKHIKDLVDTTVKNSGSKADKIDKLIETIINKENKLDKLLETMNKLVENGQNTVYTSTSIPKKNMSYTAKDHFNNLNDEDSIPMYVPSLDVDEEFNKANIVTKTIESEGTQDILNKLKAMQNN